LEQRLIAREELLSRGSVCRSDEEAEAAGEIAATSGCSCPLRLVVIRERAALQIGHQPARRGHRGHRHELIADQWVGSNKGTKSLIASYMAILNSDEY
jgi:hypothetical protein